MATLTPPALLPRSRTPPCTASSSPPSPPFSRRRPPPPRGKKTRGGFAPGGGGGNDAGGKSPWSDGYTNPTRPPPPFADPAMHRFLLAAVAAVLTSPLAAAPKVALAENGKAALPI